MFDFGTIINKSIAITKRNKWLWVLGAIAGGGMSLGNNWSSGGTDLKEIFEKFPGKTIDVPKITQESTKVLGMFYSYVSEWFYNVGPINWVLLFLGIGLAVLSGIILSMIIQAWARVGLISAIDRELDGKQSDLALASATGIAKIKNLFIFSFISIFLIIIPIMVILTLAGIFHARAFSNELYFIAYIFLGIIPGVIFTVVGIIFMLMISIYAERLIVLSSYSPWQAWKKGLSLSKGNFMGTAIMGLINTIAATAFGCVTTIIMAIILGIPGFIIIYPNIKNREMPGMPEIIVLGIFLLVFIFGQTVFGAIISVFKFANWNQVFREVIKNDK